MKTKQAIFDRALALFSEKGYNGVSMRDIARSVGIKGSSIYNHYKGKQAIMDEICQAFVRTLTVSRPPLSRLADKMDRLSARDVFKSLIVAYGSQIDERSTQMARFIFSEHFYNEAARTVFLTEIMDKNVSYYVSVLTELEQRGKIKATDKRLVSVLFNNEQVMLSIQYAHSRTAEERKKTFELMMRSVDYFLGKLEV